MSTITHQRNHPTHCAESRLYLPNPEGFYITKHVQLPISGLEGCLAKLSDGRLVVLYNDHISIWNGAEEAEYLKDLNWAPAQGVAPPVNFARNACALAVGDVDGLPGEEIVVSTLGGRVVWFPLTDITTYGLEIPFTRNQQTIGGVLYDHQMSTSLAATWAMTVKTGAEPKIHAVDRTGDWWEVNPINGQTTMSSIVWGKPMALYSLNYGGAGSSGLAGFAGGTSNTNSRWEVSQPGVFVFLNSSPYLPNTYSNWVHNLATDTTLPASILAQEFWISGMGGAVQYDPVSGAYYYAYWNYLNPISYLGNPPESSVVYPNLVQRFRYTIATPPTGSIWGSTGNDVWSGQRPDPPSAVGGNTGLALRSERPDSTSQNLQSLGIGWLSPPITNLMPDVIVGSPGGRVIALNGANGQIRYQSADYGFGGSALAVKDLTGDGRAEVVFAPLYCPTGANLEPMHSRVVILKESSNGFMEVSSATVGYPTNANDDLHGYGALGIAVADLTGDGKPEILVTTAQGEIVVFAQNDGMLNTTPLWRRIVDGACGGFNSIIVDNLDPATPKPEVYIATTQGIRKFLVDP